MSDARPVSEGLLRIGLIGPGKIADRNLAPAITASPHARLWSVLSRDPARGAAFAAKHGACAPTPAPSTLAELLADPELDAVVIASPDGLHAEHALACAAAGKHVLCEKPLTTSAAAAERVTQAFRAADLRLGVAYHLRFHVGHRLLLRRVREGMFGELRHLHAHWTFHAPDASNWRAKPEVGRRWGLAGVGTHCLDMVRWFVGPEAGDVRRIESLITRSRHRGPHDETAMVGLEFESGVTAQITTSVLYASATRFELYGSQDAAICESTFGPYGGGRIRTGAGDLGFSPLDPYIGEIDDFCLAIRDGRDPEVPGEVGTANVALLERIAPA